MENLLTGERIANLLEAKGVTFCQTLPFSDFRPTFALLFAE